MARKRTPTKQLNESRASERFVKDDKSSKNNTARTDGMSNSRRPSPAIPPLTVFILCVSIFTVAVCYSLYPELTHFAGQVSHRVPSLRTIIEPDKPTISHVSKRNADNNVETGSVKSSFRDTPSFSEEQLPPPRETETWNGQGASAKDKQALTESEDVTEDSGSSAEAQTSTSKQMDEKKSKRKDSLDEASEDSFKDAADQRTKSTDHVKEERDEVITVTYESGKETQDIKTETIPEGKPYSDANRASVVRKSSSIRAKKKKVGPIILNEENASVKLDVDQMKIQQESEKHIFRGDAGLGNVKTKRLSQSGEELHRSAVDESVAEKKNGGDFSGSKSKRRKVTKTPSPMPDASTMDQQKSPTDSFQPVYQRTFTPKKIFYAGRRIAPVELLHQNPSNSSVKVYLFDDFLSEQECDGLMKVHDSHVQSYNKPPILCFDSIRTLRKHIRDAGKKVKVTPKVFTSGTMCLNSSFSLQMRTWLNGNWSYSTAFYPGESKFSTNVAARMERAMGLQPGNGGKFQITSYPLEKAYKTHTDCTLDGTDKRDRVVSVLMYLNDADDGGETKFPDLGIWVTPKKGRAIVWNNMSPSGVCEPHSRHAASLVKQGKKYILIRWYYYKSFPGLGQRPSPPGLPAREKDQAMVACDDYDNGSCRWYDEWAYEHLLDYQQNKAYLT